MTRVNYRTLPVLALYVGVTVLSGHYYGAPGVGIALIVSALATLVWAQSR